MRILVVKLADLGDLLISEPAIRSLRVAYPDARIDLLTTRTAAPLAELFGHDLECITFDKGAFDAPGLSSAGSIAGLGILAASLRRAHYDRVVLLHHLTTTWGAAKFRALVAATGAPLVAGLDNGRGDFLTARVLDRGFGAVHEVRYMLDVAMRAGGVPVDPYPALKPAPADVPEMLPDAFLAIAPKAGAFAGAREWPLERFIALAADLAAGGHHLAIIGGTDAIESGEAIINALPAGTATNLTGKTSLAETAATIVRARLLVGNDSFPGHLAAAVGTQVVSIFGPSNHRAWRPNARPDVEGRVVTANLPCSPCLYTGHRLGRREGCSQRTCLHLIEPESVSVAIAELLSA